MKTKKLDALLILKQIEDQLVPRLRLNLVERVVHYRLLRHTRLEGRLKLRFSIVWLTRGIRLSAAPARQAAPATSSKSCCLTKFTPPPRTGLCLDASPAGRAPPASTRRISSSRKRAARPFMPVTAASASTA